MTDTTFKMDGQPCWPKLLKMLGASALALMGTFGGPASAGETVDLSAYKGKVVYLDFWASWCHPCEQSFPYMETLKSRYGEKDLVILAVNVDHRRDRADAFLQRIHSDLSVVYDSSGQIADQYHVKDMPTSILIGRDGKVRYVHNGFFPEQLPTYNAQLAELINDH